MAIVERLARGGDLGADRVSEALGVRLVPTLDSPMARHYRAPIPDGPFGEAELRVIPATGYSFLVLRASPLRPVRVSAADLRVFGEPKWRSVEPKARPEGAVSEGYALGDIDLRIGYGAESRLLEVVSLGRGRDKETEPPGPLP
ncbi:MAG TPA: hypothetical protein VIL46_08210 [Gemmataceae bacterium]